MSTQTNNKPNVLWRKKVTEEYRIKMTKPGKHKLHIIEEYVIKT